MRSAICLAWQAAELTLPPPETLAREGATRAHRWEGGGRRGQGAGAGIP